MSVKIIGWVGSAGDYYRELEPEFGVDYRVNGATRDGVTAYRTIRRKLVCLTKNVDLAIAQAKQSGVGLTINVLGSDGEPTTMTFPGAWHAKTIDTTPYETGFTLISMLCKVRIVPAFSFNLPDLVTIENDESDASVIHLKYNDTVIMSWDAGDAADGSGLNVVADLRTRQDYEPEDTTIVSLRLFAHGVLAEGPFSVSFKDLPLDWYRGSREQKLYGPVLYPDGELDTDALAALAARAGCEVADIKSRVETIEVKATGEAVPTWGAVGAVSTSGSVVTELVRPIREFPTDLRQVITYYRVVQVYVRDQARVLRECRELGLRWTKDESSILKLMYGRFVWHQWDVSALEPEP